MRLSPGLAFPALVAVLATVAAGVADAQTAMEIRGSSTRYRFVDLNHTFGNGIMVDALYLGVPGQNELYLGAGWQWKAAPALTLIPLAYGVAGRENEERGVMLGAYVLAGSGPWKAIAFAGRFICVSGHVRTYDFLDSLDLTRTLHGRWDVGASASVYREREGWSQASGPMIRRNDGHGSWALSVRFGYETEIRLVRVLTFGPPAP